MGPGAGTPESEESGEPPRTCGKCDNYKKCTIVLTVAVVFSLLIAVIVPTVRRPKLPSADLCPPAGPACPDGWIGYRGKCYYFSERDGNWTYSQSHCSAFNASLAGIDSDQEMDFMLRYKGNSDHWIGLRRDQGQPWKWTNGTELNKLFEIGGDGACAYLNDEKRITSSRCNGERFWICTEPDAFTKAKKSPVEGGS